ncbi:MAG: histidinol-phosphatase [Planctomyces sp.]|nr:histidinol-phosphatase [Planctomyces sp.]
MTTHLIDRLHFALKVSQKAADLILTYYQGSQLGVESKSDESPVTVADRGAEALIRAELQSHFPDDGILGEEFPDVAGKNGFRWILDPIDGTKPFIHGVPLFGTLIGVELNGRMVIGVCRFPALNEVVYAAENEGTWWQIGERSPVRTFVTAESSLSRARLMFTEPTSWVSINRYDSMVNLIKNVRIARGWGDCYGHAMVATGRAEIAVDPQMSAWDIAALIPILREAGGVCVDWQGIETVYGGDGVSVNAALASEVVAFLKNAPRLPSAPKAS